MLLSFIWTQISIIDGIESYFNIYQIYYLFYELDVSLSVKHSDCSRRGQAPLSMYHWFEYFDAFMQLINEYDVINW